MPYLDFVCAEDRSDDQRQVADVLRLDGKFTDFVNRYTRKDGTLVDVLWSASWSESDKIMFCVAHDITDRARIEKRFARGERKKRTARITPRANFLSRMSYELRTPLNAILGFGQFLEQQESNKKPSARRVGHIIRRWPSPA